MATPSNATKGVLADIRCLPTSFAGMPDPFSGIHVRCGETAERSCRLHPNDTTPWSNRPPTAIAPEFFQFFQSFRRPLARGPPLLPLHPFLDITR
ncbi:hypothetical protein GCM10027271_04330 [Saccharopolyspora gloriosae]